LPIYFGPIIKNNNSNFIITCSQQGSGFGEYAILATSNKIRSCAAVALDEGTMMLVMHADTYNTVLRQHHYRQKQLSSATALLQELPLFKHHNYSKVASIAYTMRSQTYSNQTLIISYGDFINNVMLIASGQVKVYAAPVSASDAPGGADSGGGSASNKEHPLGKGTVAKLLQKRIPKLAIALLGRGQIIGEMEIQKGLRSFQMTYEASASSTEILEMPATVFKECFNASNSTQSMLYKNIEEMNEAKEMRRVGRMTRAYDAMKSMMGSTTQAETAKAQLNKMLPTILDPPVASSLSAGPASSSVAGAGHTSGYPASPSKHQHVQQLPPSLSGRTFHPVDQTSTVNRKASFSMVLDEHGHLAAAGPSVGVGAAGDGTRRLSVGMRAVSGTGSLKFTESNSNCGSVAGSSGVRRTSKADFTSLAMPTGSNPTTSPPGNPRPSGTFKLSPRSSLGLTKQQTM
jgi:CRP-like cAMP-binding protein